MTGLEKMRWVKSLPEDQRCTLEDYFVKTNPIADHECQHLYVQGAKDCVELLKKTRCAVREVVRTASAKAGAVLHIGDEFCRKAWYNN